MLIDAGDWSHASSDCKSKSGNLTDIGSKEELKFLITYLENVLLMLLVNPVKTSMWLGLTYQEEEGNWTWTSGIPYEFTAWAPGQPGLNNTEKCALMEFDEHSNFKGWHDYSCDERHTWVCKYVTSLNGTCPDHLVQDIYLIKNEQTFCYEFVLGHAGDWNHALSDCKLKGGSLTDIGSKEELQFLITYIKNVLSVPVSHVKTNMWLGLTYQEEEETWTWTSGIPFEFTAWAPGQPDNSEKCALMKFDEQPSFKGWHTYPCDQRHNWVCKYDIKK